MVGLVPDVTESVETQLTRGLLQLKHKATDLDRFIYLMNLLDTNEALFYPTLMSDPALRLEGDPREAVQATGTDDHQSLAPVPAPTLDNSRTPGSIPVKTAPRGWKGSEPTTVAASAFRASILPILRPERRGVLVSQ